ncbi:MAG: beta-galactosidase [Phycisphaerales bacterium]|nr:beta-galactosidase [Phycisphaerales bacterium]
MSDQPIVSPSPLYIGAAWQPELWPEDQWALDVARMKEVGINCVRLFDFAWHRFEPREWEFDFEWAVRILDMLKEAGISVVAATPTAAPPAWMTAKYPEILQVTPEGRRTGHGRARRYSVVSSRYREFCSRIVDQMVHAFRGHDAIVGWQIDNQMSGADYGNEARRTFHSWLHERFGQVESLNKTWGLEFASQAYEYFEQIPIPPVGDVGHGPIPVAARYHPSLMIAFQRFINDQWSSFIQTQCEVTRSGFDKPLSTNMTPDWGMNYFRQNHLLDRVGMSLSGDAADLSASLMHFDRMRAEKPGVPFWLLGAKSDAAGASAFAWLSTLMGGELLLLDQWRQPWAGPEMSRGGIVTATGRWTAERGSLARLTSQFKEQAEYLGTRPPVEARVGVVMSNESAWAFSIEPPEPDFEYEKVWRDDFYLPVAQSHYWRDVIDQTADFCPYHVILMPLVPMVFRPTKERLKEWVEEGGCLLLGPLTGHRTEEFTAWTDQEFGGLEELMGATCSGMHSTAEREGATILWGAETAAPQEPLAEASPTESPIPSSTPRGLCYAFAATTAHVLARYHGGAAAGEAAILMNKVGKGTVITLGARVDRESYLDLVHTLCELAKVEPLATGSGHVAVIPRMNADTTIAAYGVVNLTQERQTITLPKAGTDRLSGRSAGPEIELEPREVLLVEVA